jgi:mRNA interferase RelE/StbE
LAWTIEYDPLALKEIGKLSKQTGKSIFAYMDTLTTLDDPTVRGKALTGPFAGLWRYRVGDYRVLCVIDRGRLTIVAVEVRHRSVAYRRR